MREREYGESKREMVRMGEVVVSVRPHCEDKKEKEVHMFPLTSNPNLIDRPGFPQLVLRLGYGLHAPATPRRSVREVLLQ